MIENNEYSNQFPQWLLIGSYPSHFDFNAAETSNVDKASYLLDLDEVATSNIFRRHCYIGKITIKKGRGECR